MEAKYTYSNYNTNPNTDKDNFYENKFDAIKSFSNRVTLDSTKASMKGPSFKPTITQCSADPTNFSSGRTIQTEKQTNKKFEFQKNNSNSSFNRLRTYSSKNIEETSQCFVENVKQLENMICDIKFNGFIRIKAEIDERSKELRIAQGNVNSLENTLKILKSHNKQSGVENNKLIKENDKLMTCGDKAQKELYFIHKEIPELKNEIEKMNDEISLKNEELRYIRNDNIELDKEVLMLKDDIKKLNKSTTDIKKEKENLKNGIVLLKKHIVTLKEKIDKQDAGSREFLNDVSILLNQSYHSVQSIRGINK